jgi:hypothetical protein
MKSLVIDGEFEWGTIAQWALDILGWHQLGTRHRGIFSEITFSHG